MHIPLYPVDIQLSIYADAKGQTYSHMEKMTTMLKVSVNAFIFVICFSLIAKTNNLLASNGDRRSGNAATYEFF